MASRIRGGAENGDVGPRKWRGRRATGPRARPPRTPPTPPTLQPAVHELPRQHPVEGIHVPDAANHKHAFVADLHLDPGARGARSVCRWRVLRHHAFVTTLLKPPPRPWSRCPEADDTG